MPREETIFELQAEVCKTLANPKRLEIINALKDGERTAGDIVDALGVHKAVVSLHLGVMRHRGVLASRKEGQYVYYRIANPKVVQACTLMKEVLLETLGKHPEKWPLSPLPVVS
jgi:ArsR family transcriptional regulator